MTMQNLIHPITMRRLPSWRTMALGFAVFAISFPLWLR